MSEIAVIVAATKNGGIGKDNKIPWKIVADMKYFQRVTKGEANPRKINCCIMGKKTYFSLPPSFRPLPARYTIVLTSESSLFDDGKLLVNCLAKSLEEGIEKARRDERIDKIFIAGGGKLIDEAIAKGLPEKIYLTEIDNDFPCDVFISPIPSENYDLTSVSETLSENGIDFRWKVFTKKKA